jgi:hypothetical protein
VLIFYLAIWMLTPFAADVHTLTTNNGKGYCNY